MKLDSNKPLAIKWIYVLLIIRSIFLVVFLSLLQYVIYTRPESGFWAGFADSSYKYLKVNDTYTNPGNLVAYAIGKHMFQVVFILLQFYSIQKRKKLTFWITWSLDFIMLLGVGSFPLFSLIIFFLAISKKVRSYFKASNLDNNNYDSIVSN